MKYLSAIAIFMFSCGSVCAFTDGEIAKFDKDGSKSINTEKEATAYLLHKQSAIFAKFDTDADGKLDVQEVQVLEKTELELAFDGDVLFGQDIIDIRAGRPIALETLQQRKDKPAAPSVQAAAPPSDGRPDSCDAAKQDLFVRRDKVDTGIYVNMKNGVDRTNALGAKVAYVRDDVADSDTATIDGAVTLVLGRDPCVGGTIDGIPHMSGYAFAAWVTGDGSLSDLPAKDKSALLFGLDTQLEIADGQLFDIQSINFSGYYQTDYRGEASAYGAKATWQPYNAAIGLGSPPDYNLFSDYVTAYWVVQAEADILRVDDPGLTNLKADADYAWLGGTAQLKLFLFNKYFDNKNKLYSTLSYNYYYNAAESGSIELFSAELGYNISDDGSTSVSFEYQNGTIKNTLQDVDQYMVNLNYKY